MKDKIVYLFTFILLFGAVTGGLIYFNSIYNNIFWFDFSPVKIQVNAKDKNPNQNKSQVDSLKVKGSEPNAKDSTKIAAVKVDSSKTSENQHETSKTNNNVKNNVITGTAKNSKPIEAVPTPPVQNPVQTSSLSNLSKAKKDSIYNGWVKETVKLYESMDSRKAAKVIMGYSDNIARDLILKMKKKKAAEILAELKPEVVTRIISVTQ